jgi:peptidyl-dipeptidase Dcp
MPKVLILMLLGLSSAVFALAAGIPASDEPAGFGPAAAPMIETQDAGGEGPLAPAPSNPFLAPWNTPYNVPPFDRIQPEHFIPAFEEGMRLHKAEVAAIIDNPEAPTFDNTLVALDRSGKLLSDVATVFFGLYSANTNDELQKISVEMAPRLAAHQDEISMNPKLFARVKAVYDVRDTLKLTPEQRYLLEQVYKGYVRSGVNLGAEDQAKLKSINQQLSRLAVQFNQNLLAETNAFRMVLDKKEDLAGLPESAIAAAAAEAKAAGLEGKWVFTVQKPSMLPFLTYSTRPDLRAKLYAGYTQRGDQANEHNNTKVLADIVKLREERAKLLGYPTYADYVLENRMARTPAKVMELLNRLWAAALPIAKRDRDEFQAMLDKERPGGKLAAADWWFYAEKQRKAKYDLDDTELRPYFRLENVRDGAFWVANQLYGLTFEPLTDIPKPHPEAVAFRVKDADGSYLGILYQDFHPRPSKRVGAWCGTYRDTYQENGQRVPPVVTMVCNFTRPSGDTPALLSVEEAETLFHEFGHALDNLLSRKTYDSSFRATDFVELPSQIMEHWATAPEVLRHYAVHYQTGAAIPEVLIEKITKSGYFNQGFQTVEYLAASLLDMQYHSLTEPKDLDVDAFEKSYLDGLGLIPEILPRYRSTYFAHIIGGYAAGYYSYIWSGVLDCDAFEAFRETSLFDKATAERFRKSVLEVNGTMDSAEMYRNFRGRDPKIDALLKDRGLM